MCLSIPSRVTKIDKVKNTATVDTFGVSREASLDLMAEDDVKIGDFVLIHIGFVMNKIDEEDALLSLETYREILAQMEEECIQDDNSLSSLATHEERQQAIKDGDNCPNG